MIGDRDITQWARMSADIEGWRDLAERVQELPPESAYVLVREMGEQLPEGADPRLAIRSDVDALGHVIAGAAMLVRANRARGFHTANKVSNRQWEQYFAWRGHAEELLMESVDLAPEYGLAAAWLMAAAVDGSEDLKDHAERIIAKATSVPISGHSKHLSAWTEKWGGSHEAMWKVARASAIRRPPWTGALIAKAHYEHWLYLSLMDEDPTAAERADCYFDRAVIDELSSISRAVFEGEASDPYEAVYAHDVLAAALAAAGRPQQAMDHLRKVGRFGDPALLTGGPWWRRAIVRKLNGLPLW